MTEPARKAFTVTVTALAGALSDPRTILVTGHQNPARNGVFDLDSAPLPPAPPKRPNRAQRRRAMR